MKSISFIAIAILLLVSFQSFSQDDDDWATKTYRPGEFTGIKLEGGFRVFLIQGNENTITVKATDSEVFDQIEVKTGNDELKLEVDRKTFNFNRVNLYITFKTLESIKIEGGVKLSTRGYLNLNDLSVAVEGGAKIELDVKAENVQISGEGGVLFELKGVAESLDVKVSGAGHVNADELKTKDVTFRVEGVGTGSVYATKTLNASIQGVGKVRYRGNPEVTKYIDGVGSVTGN